MPIVIPAASALPDLTLRVDDTGTAFGDAPTWTDYSADLATAGDGQPISITRGRQDGQGEPQPATCTFMLENTSGAYTPGNPAAAAGWDVGARVNVRLTVGATTYDRFDGYVDSIEPAYTGLDWSVVQVTATDVTARLAIGQPLQSLVVQEMLADSPVCLYTLADSDAAGDLSGHAHPPLIVTHSKYGSGTISFGSETDLPDGSPGVAFDSTAAGTAPAKALSVLRAQAVAGHPMMPLTDGTNFEFECWFSIGFKYADILSSSLLISMVTVAP